MAHLEITTPVSLPASTAETVVGSIGPLSVPGPTPTAAPAGVPTIVTGRANVTVGTGGTGVTWRIRQGVGLAGAVVGTAPVDTVAAAASLDVDIYAEDLVGASQNGYTITMAQNGAPSAVGSVNSASADFNPQ